MSLLARTTPPRHGRLMLPLAAVALALLVTGCDGSSAPAASSGATPAATGAAHPSGPPSSPPAPDAGTPAHGTAAPASSGAAAASRPAPGPGRCTAEGLAMRLGRPDAGAGQVYYRLTFTNRTGSACTLRGFPGVSLIKRDGAMIGVPAAREGGTHDVRVIRPGRSASVTLHTVNQGIEQSACWDAPDYLRVYPPGSREALTLRTALPRVCGDRFTTTAVDS
ncbi:DUF4232 domain-containing protein [Streptomyces sp. NPDC001478]